MRRPLALGLAVVSLLVATWQAVAVEVIGVPRIEPRDERSAPAIATTRHATVVGAAGDIACEAPPNGDDAPRTCQYDDTAALLRGTGLSRVLLLGDIQYEQGEYRAFRDHFDPTWGRVFGKLAPAPGNHDHAGDPNSRPRGYFRYFGDAARGPDGLGYYSFDLGACPEDPCWHVISLDSMLCFTADGCDAPADPADPGPGERMYVWLADDLAANADRTCTLAFWHHPRFSHSTGSGATTAVAPLWDLLYAARADVVLNGHSHNYQRWRPQDPTGTRDPEAGIRQFVVGTGGRSLYAIAGGEPPENLAAAQAEAFGILRLRLKAAGFAWTWVSAPGQPAFEDAGRARCV
jgi:hypothetical protein